MLPIQALTNNSSTAWFKHDFLAFTSEKCYGHCNLLCGIFMTANNKPQKRKKDLKMHITIIRDIDFSCFHEMKQKLNHIFKVANNNKLAAVAIALTLFSITYLGWAWFLLILSAFIVISILSMLSCSIVKLFPSFFICCYLLKTVPINIKYLVKIVLKL